MRIATVPLAFACTLALTAPALGAPMRFEPGAIVIPVEAIAPVDQDNARQGFVTAFRSPVLGVMIQGRGRPGVDPSPLRRSTISLGVGGWTVSTAVATASVFLPILGGVPQLRLEAAQQPMPALASILSLRELGQLDGGTAAMRRVIEGQRVGSDTDPIALLSSTR